MADNGSPKRTRLGQRNAAPHDSTLGQTGSTRRGQLRPVSRPRRIYEKGRLRIDFDAYEVFLDNRRVHLFLREYEVLCFLAQWPNRVFDRSEILNAVWGLNAPIDPRTIDVHIRRLRAAVERDPGRPELILTVRRVGYKFDERALQADRRDSWPAKDP